MTPVVRSFISIPAGVFGARLGRYVALTAVGSAIWCFAFAGAGWAAGASWETFHERFRFVDYAVAGVIVLGIGAVVWRAIRSSAGGFGRRREGRASAGAVLFALLVAGADGGGDPAVVSGVDVR